MRIALIIYLYIYAYTCNEEGGGGAIHKQMFALFAGKRACHKACQQGAHAALAGCNLHHPLAELAAPQAVQAASYTNGNGMDEGPSMIHDP